MRARTSPLHDSSGDMLRLFPRLIAYARGLGCSEEDAPSLVRDAALQALAAVRPGVSLDDLEETLRRDIGIRCLAADQAPKHGSSGEYLEGTRLAHQELQLNLEALDRIDPDLRRVFVLRIFNRMGFGGIAKALRLPLRQVKAKAERATREIAAMRNGGRLPAATLRIAPTSARMAAVSAPVGSSVALAPKATAARIRRAPAAKAVPGSLSAPVPELTVVSGGKKWSGPGMV